MNTLYLDIFSGISGDMFMAALLDLGVDLPAVERELRKMPLEFHLHHTRVQRQAIDAVKFDVHLERDHHHDNGHGREHAHEHHHEEHDHGREHPHAHEHEHEHHHGHGHGRTFAEIRTMIEGAGLSPWTREKSLAVFRRIAAAEGKIHGLPPDKVHFHEVGAVDSIVDIVGGCAALEQLGRPRVVAGSVVDGHGWIDCAHGRFPIPAPATLEILAARGVSITQCDEPHELITPTGAALLAELAEEFGPMRGLAARRVGLGAGSRENKTRPNILRAILGDASAAGGHDWESDTIAVLETNLDDATAEIIGHFLERAMAAGALDVFHTPIQMKKNRPGTLLTVLCAADRADAFSEMMLRETTAFGVRRSLAERRKLRREFRTVETAFGPVTVKIGLLDGRAAQIAPEYESCRKLADEKNVALKDVFDAARQAAGKISI